MSIFNLHTAVLDDYRDFVRRAREGAHNLVILPQGLQRKQIYSYRPMTV